MQPVNIIRVRYTHANMKCLNDNFLELLTMKKKTTRIFNCLRPFHPI